MSVHLGCCFKAVLRKKACRHQHLPEVMRSPFNFSMSLHSLDGKSCRIHYFVWVGKLLSPSMCKGTSILQIYFFSVLNENILLQKLF